MTTLEDLEALDEALAYWNELADLVGWKLYGFTYKNSASFDTGGLYHNTIQLTANQRDDIVRAIKNAAATHTTIWP